VSSVLLQIIFKCGDDPRQDQLVIQLISLMDSLMKKVSEVQMGLRLELD
jgi:phosphatidylinositol kinase/protein kinase (PI-3  family)